MDYGEFQKVRFRSHGESVEAMNWAFDRMIEFESILEMMLSAKGDHMSACDKIMGASHPCTCGANKARELLKDF